MGLRNKIILFSKLALGLLCFSPSLAIAGNNCGTLNCGGIKPFCCIQDRWASGTLNACPAAVPSQNYQCASGQLTPKSPSMITCRSLDKRDTGWMCNDTSVGPPPPTACVNKSPLLGQLVPSSCTFTNDPSSGCDDGRYPPKWESTVAGQIRLCGGKDSHPAGSKMPTIKCSGFGLGSSLPTGAVIKGVAVVLGESSDHGLSVLNTISLLDGGTVLATKTVNDVMQYKKATPGEVVKTHGGSTDLWGAASLSEASIKNLTVAYDYTDNNDRMYFFDGQSGQPQPQGVQVWYDCPTADGACGTANGTSPPAAPSTAAELCSSAGGATAVSGPAAGPWSWTCLPLAGGKPMDCKTIPPPATPTPDPTPSDSKIVLISASPLYFNDVVLTDTSDPQSFTFQNQGAGIATNCSTSWISGNSGDFAFTDGCKGSIAVNGTCTVTATGKPPGSETTGHKVARLGVTCSNFPGGVATGDLDEVAQTYPVLQPLNPLDHIFGPLGSNGTDQIGVAVGNSGTLKATNCTVNSGPDSHFSSDIGTCGSIPTAGCTFQAKTKADDVTTGASYFTTFSITCTGLSSTTSKYQTASYVGNPNFTASSTVLKYELDTSCSVEGAIKTATNTCQCPVGYEVTDIFGTDGAGLQKTGCRPKLPSKDYFRKATTAAQSDGFPVCGDNRFPVDDSFVTANYTQFWKPKYTSVVTNTGVTPNYNYEFASGTSGISPSPTYVYQNLTRCVCNSNGAGGNAAAASQTSATAAQLSKTMPSGTVRFVPDYLDIIAPYKASDATAGGPPAYSEVAIASVANVYGAAGQVYNAGQSRCGCPNFNEYADSLDPGHTLQAGSVCRPMLDLTNATTANYKILTKYDPAVHLEGTQKFSDLGKYERSFNLPQQGGGNAAYTRRIWGCAPPFELQKVGTTLTCVFKVADNLCDDGTGGGGPSAVSANMSSAGGGTKTVAAAVAKFKNTVNKRLACCTNVFDPTILGVKDKFDCVDNSTTYGPAYADFNTLWRSSTEGLPNGILLSNSSGQPVSGFYTLGGVRCPEFNEFAGKIQSTVVNPLMLSSQQNLAGNSADLTKVQKNDNQSIAQPEWVAKDAGWVNFVAGKSVPTTAEQMRRCPILVRAAIQTECPTDGTKPADGTAYPKLPSELLTYNNGGTLRCSAAAKVQVRMRVEQITTITGSKPMTPIDSVTDTSQAINVQVSDWIKSKSAGNCSSGATLAADGSCVFQ